MKTNVQIRAPSDELEAWRRAVAVLLAYYKAMAKTHRESKNVCG